MCMLSHYGKEAKFCRLCLNVNDPATDCKFLCLLVMTGYDLLTSLSLVLFSFHFGGS